MQTTEAPCLDEAGEVSGRKKGRSKSGEVSRLHINLPDELSERLKKIQDETYAGSITEVIKNALVLYTALLDEHKRGRHVFTQSDSGENPHRIAVFL
jgi:hypothetical protein